MYSKELTQFIDTALKSSAVISASRKERLESFVDFIVKQLKATNNVDLIFICTHNSRRSHFSQIWAQVAANYYMLPVNCYSGGTEATAVYKSVLSTLTKNGLNVIQLSDSANPIYAVKDTAESSPVIAFSKKFDTEFNPQKNFGAVMTCADADVNCPFIPSALQRISLPYEDPKKSDNSPEEDEHYMSKSHEIARELFYVFKQVTEQL